MRFIIDESFRLLFPEALVGIVVASGIDNRRNRADSGNDLASAVALAAAAIGEDDLATHPAVAPWREVYRRFGVKPSRYHSSIEGLLRTARTGEVRSVNPLVDLYNAVSLGHLLPCGGEDLDAIEGDLRLTIAAGGEPFVPLGSGEELPPAAGEVVYADDAGVVCRAWNWREADRTKLSPETTRAVLVIEALPPRTEENVRAACDDLAAMATMRLGATCRVVLFGANGVFETSLDA
ncbi:MAG: phenylalanine--tRNA ligase beta subunit-related protein [Dehalococcoidia bacterium]